MADPSQSLAARGGYSIAELTRPIFTSKVPYSEWAGRVRYGAEIDTSRIESTVRAADVGIMWPMADMAREMLGLNPKAAGIVNKGLLPLAAADHDVTPAEGDGLNPDEAARVATKIREILKAIPGFKQALLDLAWGFFDGRAGLEKQLVRRPTGTGFEVWCERLDWIQPQRLSFEESRRLIVVDRWGDYGLFTRRGPVLDDVPGKFVTFTPRMFGDLQEREGLAPRYLYWLLFDRVNWRQRFLVSEQFGIPWRLIETQIAETLAGMKLGLPTRQDGGEGGAPGDDGVALDYAVQEAQNVVRDGVWAGLPGQKLRVEFPPDSVREFFSQGSDQILERLAFLTLHNSLSAAAPDAEAGRAGAVVNLGGENTVLDFRGALVSEVVQAQLVDVLVELNFGAAALPYSPTFQLRTQPPRDRDKETDRVLKVAAAVPVGAGSLYEASGVRPPNKGEDIVTPAPAGGAPGLPFGEGGAGSSPAALPHGESGSEDANGAIRDLVESADEDDQAAAADAEADGGHLARFFATPGRLVQPATVHGSPDVIVERGVREAVRFTSAWADELVDAVTGDDPARIYRNLAARERTLDVEPFTRALERRIVHTLMLGALDADHEATSDVTIAPATFDGGGRDFTALPFGEAIKAFAEKKVMTRRQFDRLTADAKRKAFTVAGLTTKRMLTTAHDELQKAITAGVDLREFSKSLGARFDAAGWTRLNPSHVENVFRTNVMGAYSDGRRAQMTQPHVLAARPYWQILGVDDARTRKTHAEAHGKVLPANDPFFARSGPPFGFQCRCRVISRSKKDLERLGLTPTFGAALKGLPDPGWSADAIAPPASYEPEDGPPPKAAPPAYRPAPFKDLPVEPLPKTEQPPEGAKGYLAFQKEQLAKCSAGEVKAIRSFTHGFDWTIREIDKGRSTDEILAGITAERARMPGRKWRTTPEQHLEQAKAYHRDLYSALRRMAPVSERTVLRGLRALDAATFKAILASEHVEIGAVSSASWDLNVAAHFAEVPYATDGAHSVLFKLKAKSARAIESVSKHRDERELLLMKGTRFRVVRVYRPEGAGAAAAAVVEAEEI